MKFYECYSKKKDRILNINELKDNKEFYADIYCPECFKAMLTYCNGIEKNPYLRTKKGSKHEYFCPYNYEIATKEQFIKYIDCINKNSVKSKLNSVLNILKRDRYFDSNSRFKEVYKREIKDAFTFSENGKKENKVLAIPRKKVNKSIDEKDVDKIYLIYGTVKLKCNMRKNSISDNIFYALDVKLLIKNEWRTKLSIILKEKISIDENREYDIALIGKINIKNGYINIKLIDDYIMYKEI